MIGKSNVFKMCEQFKNMKNSKSNAKELIRTKILFSLFAKKNEKIITFQIKRKGNDKRETLF